VAARTAAVAAGAEATAEAAMEAARGVKEVVMVVKEDWAAT
jgi:hypothetical protein